MENKPKLTVVPTSEQAKQEAECTQALAVLSAEFHNKWRKEFIELIASFEVPDQIKARNYVASVDIFSAMLLTDIVLAEFMARPKTNELTTEIADFTARRLMKISATVSQLLNQKGLI